MVQKPKWLAILIFVVAGIATLMASVQAPATNAYADKFAMYAALADQPHETIRIGGGTIEVVFADGAPGLDRPRVLNWIRNSAQAVSTYFGRYPVAKVGILIIGEDGARINGGTTFGFAGSAIRIHVGRGADDAAFAEDWIMTHEMTHLALPVVPEESAWMLEGSATYVEPIARVQAGQLPASEIWRQVIQGMPKGLPQAGDQGLDHTPTWGRIYWGGALFCLLADVSIRERTHNRFGLRDAFRAINRASGGNGAQWSMAQLASVGDAATGTTVLHDLYNQMKDTSTNVDLDSLFAKLGVSQQGSETIFDNAAPLAAVRKAIAAKS